ncbi:class I SAM-dependent methyltransferase [Bacillus nitratireducens]|uniref:class I SAM-dependent methyltransferase n=1 Tax=Bacillus nitratireducens TaxID=2026193 RepID=UPI000BED164A|nr:class I SAM-dependent methyltransferase [Bacillus nitratireducens]PEE14957.1 SAM-dependent methyltransferase [Bacillus cereus]MED0906762.1 class I SAM-dependent methyltransferase [Bacillus nitratireducens]PFH80354.1 SAM-dependent methyltransferase [Bacillus cereus]PFM45707.1 SAM-dependent methyltransferase [Bacillus cereus]PFR99920.1 SAM-dependent methyltransferase [Bacillus cereus]
MSNHEKEYPLIPPPELSQYVGGDFEKIGKEFRKLFIRIGKLKPHEKVLDVGCGVGRMAVPLMNYLNTSGSYYGFDIYKKGITWCQDNISVVCNNFHFKHIDIYNQFYNPNGKEDASQYRFPYADESFDFIFLTSVFTHLLPKELEHYLSEIVRVLKKDGRCFITFFLINTESSYYLNSGLSTLGFYHQVENCYIVNKDIPNFAVAYSEDEIQQLFTKYELKVIDKPYYGSWCGRTKFTSYQDIILITK